MLALYQKTSLPLMVFGLTVDDNEIKLQKAFREMQLEEPAIPLHMVRLKPRIALEASSTIAHLSSQYLCRNVDPDTQHVTEAIAIEPLMAMLICLKGIPILLQGKISPLQGRFLPHARPKLVRC